MRQKVSEPTNWSAMILNASAENGASSLAARPIASSGLSTAEPCAPGYQLKMYNGAVHAARLPGTFSHSSEPRKTLRARPRAPHLDIRQVQGRGQVGDHRVQQRLHALVLECGPAQHRHERVPNGALPNQRLQPCLIRILRTPTCLVTLMLTLTIWPETVD